MSKHHFTILTLLFLFISCSDTDPSVMDMMEEEEEEMLTQQERAFLEITFGNEFGSGRQNIVKWRQDMKIYVPNRSYQHLMDELEIIVQELNELNQSTQIEIVEDESLSNFTVFFGSGEAYVELEPNASSYVGSNWGLFWIYWTGGFEINRGSLYVDVFRTTDQECQKHLLREELTQSLGMMNDIDTDAESIFYQQWTCGPRFSALDKFVIELFLSDEIRNGQSRSSVEAYFLEN